MKTERGSYIDNDQKKLNRLTTEADRLYRSLEDGDAYDNLITFTGDARRFLDDIIDVLEDIGGRVEGLEYLKQGED